MPNIEIHGVDASKAHQIAGRILDILQRRFPKEAGKLGLIDNAVVTICNDMVIDHHNTPQPYLRVLSDNEEEIGDLLRVLKTLDVDIEHMKLSTFIPKSMPSAPFHPLFDQRVGAT